MLTFIRKIRARKNLITVGILVGLFVLSGALQPAHAQSCTYYVSPTGSDSNSGTLAAPWQTVQKAFNTATAGQTVCFRGGTYPRNTNNPCPSFSQAYSQCETHSGTASNPITFTNYANEVALIQGSTRISASYITVQGTPNTTPNCSHAYTCGLIFEGNHDNATDNIDVCCAGSSGSNPQFVTFDHVEIRSGTYHAGIYVEGCNNTLTGSYVHDNGNSTSDSMRQLDNGVYWSFTATSTGSACGNGGLVANNIVEKNWSKGIQLYYGINPSAFPANVVVEENTSVKNGSYGAAISGTGNVFANNILYNNGDLFSPPEQQGNLTTSGNTVDHNVTWDTTSSSRTGWNNCGTGCSETNNLSQDPLFSSPSTLDWHLTAASPAINFSNQSYVQTLDHDGNVRTNPADAGCYD